MGQPSGRFRSSMALISCPECGREVSSRAASCPHCGFALAGTAGPAGAAALGLTGATPSLAEQTIWESSPSLLLLLGETVGVLAVVLVVVLLAALLLPALREAARNSWL